MINVCLILIFLVFLVLVFSLAQIRDALHGIRNELQEIREAIKERE